MEKNTAIIDLDVYTRLVKANQSLEIEMEKLKCEVLPQYEEDLMDAKREIEILKKELILACIDEFNIKHYPLENVSNIKDYFFAIPESKRETLNQLGITNEEMIKFIKEKKHAYYLEMVQEEKTND